MGTDIDPQKLNSALIFAEQKNHIDCVQHLSEYIRASF